MGVGMERHEDGYQRRGTEMTRLESFTDAAFAFALTLLVISVDAIPESYQELVTALKGTPAFAASFASIAFLWIEHRRWSRRYGMDDAVSTVLSLILVFITLVYVYPLKMVFSGMFFWMSGGWLPVSFTVDNYSDLAGLFIIYGIGFAAVMFTFVLLYRHALRKQTELRLDVLEQAMTRREIGMSLILAGTAIASALFAWLMPDKIAIFAGFVYMTLPISMPVAALRYERGIAPLREHQS
jgi:uncharacterized membrane protein